MNRRQLLAGLGALAGGGGIITGTGAFTSVDADRQASVQVSGDVEAFMQIFPSNQGTNLDSPNGTFATSTGTPGNQLTFDFNDSGGTASGSVGVGTDSEYVFDDVFRVRNQGTQDMFVQIASLDVKTAPNTGDGGQVLIDFFASEGADTNTTGPSFESVDVIDGSSNELEVPVGASRAVGVRIETVDGSNYDGVSDPQITGVNIASGTTTTVNADASDDSSVNNVDPGTPSTTR